MQIGHFSTSGRRGDNRKVVPLMIIGLQLIAALYFVYDSMVDLRDEATSGASLELVMECVAAISLLGGVALGLRLLHGVSRELGEKQMSLARAQSAFAAHVASRFAEWRLTKGEAEVAMFALKGFDIGEIGRLRNAAAGTVRAQLSQIYAKAEVSSQAMFVSLFIEDLIGDGSMIGNGEDK